jgi:hypothetical protein
MVTVCAVVGAAVVVVVVVVVVAEVAEVAVKVAAKVVLCLLKAKHLSLLCSSCSFVVCGAACRLTVCAALDSAAVHCITM